MSITLKHTGNNHSSPTSQLDWQNAVKTDLARVTETIRQVSFLSNELLDGAINMIIEGGGKRMRPAVTVLVGRATQADYEDTIAVAASIELLHTATLVHDDLIDGANERRGVETLHSKLPLGVTVLTGDFLFAQSAALAARANNVEVVKTFADTLVAICKGEILQAQTRWTISPRPEYNERIYGKTAALFEAAAISGAILGDVSTEQKQACATFGRELGMAFQIVDDALDFVASTQKLGKPAGHDLRQGIITLPALIYLEETKQNPTEFIRQIRSADGVEAAIEAIREADAPRKALKEAHQHLARGEKALQLMAWSPALDDLRLLAEYVATRDY
jgi:geranylgeranyl pyrophosphate synthase